jgi:hypothetical protein
MLGLRIQRNESFGDFQRHTQAYTLDVCIMRLQGMPMLQELNESEGPDLERLCQGVSPNDEPCDYPATIHCPTCGRWFCDAHAEDEEWHPCLLAPGDEGGEG